MGFNVIVKIVYSAAGDPDITILTDALVTYEGKVYWQPPAIYKSFCPVGLLVKKNYTVYFLNWCNLVSLWFSILCNEIWYMDLYWKICWSSPTTKRGCYLYNSRWRWCWVHESWNGFELFLSVRNANKDVLCSVQPNGIFCR